MSRWPLTHARLGADHFRPAAPVQLPASRDGHQSHFAPEARVRAHASAQFALLQTRSRLDWPARPGARRRRRRRRLQLRLRPVSSSAAHCARLANTRPCGRRAKVALASSLASQKGPAACASHEKVVGCKISVRQACSTGELHWRKLGHCSELWRERERAADLYLAQARLERNWPKRRSKLDTASCGVLPAELRACASPKRKRSWELLGSRLKLAAGSFAPRDHAHARNIAKAPQIERRRAQFRCVEDARAGARLARSLAELELSGRRSFQLSAEPIGVRGNSFNSRNLERAGKCHFGATASSRGDTRRARHWPGGT